jgi:hypothetical protein
MMDTLIGSQTASVYLWQLMVANLSRVKVNAGSSCFLRLFRGSMEDNESHAGMRDVVLMVTGVHCFLPCDCLDSRWNNEGEVGKLQALFLAKCKGETLRKPSWKPCVSSRLAVSTKGNKVESFIFSLRGGKSKVLASKIFFQNLTDSFFDRQR